MLKRVSNAHKVVVVRGKVGPKDGRPWVKYTDYSTDKREVTRKTSAKREITPRVSSIYGWSS